MQYGIFLKDFFDVDHLKIFIKFVTILPFFNVLFFWLQDMWGLSSLTRDRTYTTLHWKAKSQSLDCQGSQVIQFY